MYNVDEKDFLIDFSRTKKRIVLLKNLKEKCITDTSQDENREFITLIASICTNKSHLPPVLIYKSESYDLQDT